MIKWLVNSIIKLISHTILKIDTSEIKTFPKEGPLLAVANHVNFLDAPVIISHLHPRPTTGLVKKESWDIPLYAFLFNVWGGIPIDRNIMDFSAFQKAKQALNEGKILAVSPEGTRSETGEMLRAKSGISILARQVDVPIIPMAYWGHEDLSENLKRLKRTPMYIRVGRKFRIDFSQLPKNKESMQAAADAIMMEIARLLPEKYRGVYSAGAFEREKFVQYLE